MMAAFRSDQSRPLLAAALIALLAGCAGLGAPYAPPPPPEPMPTSRWNGQFIFSINLPAPQPAIHDVNIAVVNAYYREEESALLAPIYSKVGKGFSASMGADLEKLLVAKGLTATGPFPTLDDITYAEKKGAALTLAPRVYIQTELRYEGPARMVPDGFTTLADGTVVQARSQRTFVMLTSGWITFVMQEPLSGEKMWIKKLELDPIESRGVEVYDARPVMQTMPGAWGKSYEIPTGQYAPGSTLLYDGKVDALADALMAVYPKTMERFWNFLDPEEMKHLKKKSQEIRARKVY
jgi:hypothetical protein